MTVDLRQHAMQEPVRVRKHLQRYAPVIVLLHDEKGHSFREIAAWLTKFGLPCDYNAVYRAYKRIRSA